MDRDTIKEAKKLGNQIKDCQRARYFAKKATDPFFDQDYSLGLFMGTLCQDKTFYESLKKLLNDTEKRLLYKFDML